MSNRSTGICLWLCALFLLTPPPLAAQTEDRAPYRADKSFYFKGRLGGNFYGGDRDRNPPNNLFDTPFAYFKNNQIGVTFGLEAGYHFTERFSLGLLYLSGNYPRIKDDQDKDGTPYLRPFYEVIDPATTSTRRRHVVVIGRTYVMPRRQVSPYGQIGFHASFGTINGQSRTGVGPVMGVGLDTWITARMGIFLELNGLFAFNDRALDLADTRSKRTPNSPGGIDASDFDTFTFFGFGVRYTLRPPSPVPVRVACSGPIELTPGALGTFTALTNEDATRPITYRWDFGDGATASPGPTATHAFAKTDTTFTVTVTASNRANRMPPPKAECPVRVVPPPDSTFQIACRDTLRLTPGEVGNFTLDITGDTTQFITYYWDFKDSTRYPTRDPQTTHWFAKPGSFPVTVTASSSTHRDEAICPVRVTPFRVACIVPDTLRTEKDLFEAEITGDTTQVVRYQWDFGDGTTASGGRTAAHAFARPGPYTVTVTASSSTHTAEATCPRPVVNCTLGNLKGIVFDRDESAIRDEARNVLNENLVQIKEFVRACNTPVHVKSTASIDECILANSCGCRCDNREARQRWLAYNRALAIARIYLDKSFFLGKDDDKILQSLQKNIKMILQPGDGKPEKVDIEKPPTECTCDLDP